MNGERTALVTGAGRDRIGNVIARDLAKSGFRTAIHYHFSSQGAESTVGELREEGHDAAAFGADLSNEKGVQTLVEEVLKTFGRIDVLVHAAAIWSPKSIELTTAADLERFWRTNTLSSFLCAQQVGLEMARRPEGGSIVLLGDWAIARPYVDFAAYLTSKGSIPTMTRALAVELGLKNPRVRVNAILPGPVMLPEDMSDAERQDVIAATLLKREGRPEHVASAARFFIDNDYITGVALPVDGGRTIYAGGD